ncbi:MAG: toprim domain-containing protein, partial [Candidatus Nitrosotenuis sp.]
DKVGPFDCKFKLNAIDDVRATKKEDIMKRAKEIKQQWATKTISEGETMLKDIHEGTSTSGKLATYGRGKLPCGAGVFDSPWIILVEGRADVINLLRAGIDNSIAIDGARIDESIKDLCDTKEKVIAFLDGDRAGGFILKELKNMIDIDIVHRAPEGVEVEELTPQQIIDILRDTIEEMKNPKATPTLSDPNDKPMAELAEKTFSQINETLEAVGLDSNRNEVFKVPISELVSKLSVQSGIKYLVLDGIVTQRLVDGAKQAGIECVIGHRIANLTNKDGIALKTFTELGVA